MKCRGCGLSIIKDEGQGFLRRERVYCGAKPRGMFQGEVVYPVVMSGGVYMSPYSRVVLSKCKDFS